MDEVQFPGTSNECPQAERIGRGRCLLVCVSPIEHFRQLPP